MVMIPCKFVFVVNYGNCVEFVLEEQLRHCLDTGVDPHRDQFTPHDLMRSTSILVVETELPQRDEPLEPLLFIENIDIVEIAPLFRLSLH